MLNLHEITFYAGGFLGDSFIIQPAPLFEEVEAVFDDEFTVGFRYAYFFHPNVGFEGGIGFTPSSILARGFAGGGGTNVRAIFDVNTYVMHANIVFSMSQATVVPYVTAGVGGVHFDINTARFGFLTPSETDFAFNAGGGVKFRLTKIFFERMAGFIGWILNFLKMIRLHLLKLQVVYLCFSTFNSDFDEKLNTNS